MFENIIGQENVVSLLGAGVHTDGLPPAMLFVGPSYAGKLSTALELARGLTCERVGDWECDCSSCQSQRELLHPYTVMLGNRYFDQEISATARVFLATPCKPSFYLFLRSVRKLLRRFDNFLWDEHDNHYRKAKPLLTQVSEQLADLNISDYTELAKKKAREIQQLVDRSIKLAAVLRGYHVSIGQVRALRHWCTTTAWQKKIVIIEEVDRMNEGARNGLLKILEEPPQGLYFVMIAPSKSTVMPTLLSRLRTYLFLTRSSEQQAQILERVFRQKNTTASLTDFFSSPHGDHVRGLANQFYSEMQNSGKFSDAYPGEGLDENFEEFLSCLCLEIQDKWRKGQVPSLLAQEQVHQLSFLRHQFLIYRQGAQSLAENFFFTYFGRKN